MNITILGWGNIGRTIAAQFIREEHNVFLVVNKREEIDYIEENLDLSVIHGNSNNTAVLENANIKEADLLLAVTDDDNTNILACELANFYNKKCKKIVRISDVSYLSEEHILSKVDFKIDKVINNEEILADNLKKLIEFPGATDLSYFLDKNITVGGFKIKPNSPLFDQKIKNLPLPEEARVIAYADNGHFHLPDEEFTLQEYSILYLAFPKKLSSKIQKLINPDHRKIKSVIIYEDGNKDIQKTYYLSEILNKNLKINDVRIVFESSQKAKELSKISHNLILTGKITKPSFWHRQELNECDAFLALSENNEKNILAGLVANQLGVSTILTQAELPEYSGLTSSTPLTSILSPSILAVNQILQQIHHEEIKKMAILNYLELEAIEYEVAEKSKINNKTVQKLIGRNDFVVSHILRKGKIMIPDKKTIFKTEDKVLVISSIDNLSYLSEMFRNN